MKLGAPNIAITSRNISKKKKGLFVCFLFVLSKARLPYNSTSYLPWHLLTVKLSSLSLLNFAITLPTPTTRYNSSPSLLQLGFLEKKLKHFALYWI